MNNDRPNTAARWCENVIIADADHIDRVAFNLTVNFERMLGRRIPPADMARWIDCVALDGGVRPGDNTVQVVLIHDKESTCMENFAPGDFAADLNGKAFKDNIGEFVITSLTVEDMVSKDDLFTDVLLTAVNHADVKRIMAVPDDGITYDKVRIALRNTDTDKKITLFAMQPMQGGCFRQEILGYSLMQALGISAEEIERQR